MKFQINTNHLAGSVLAILACASFAGCTRASDQGAMNDSSVYGTTQTTTQETASNTTLAADETTTAPAPDAVAPTDASAASPDDSSKTTTKSTKSTKTKHKAKKAKKAAHDASLAPLPADPVATNEDDSYFYDSDLAQTDDGMMDPSRDIGAVDASRDFEDTISGTTMPAFYRETGLSPFAQEPDSRMPLQVGSGQLTGEDKSTTILDGPGLFQDPGALGRDLIQ